jgi:hypothetical protein
MVASKFSTTNPTTLDEIEAACILDWFKTGNQPGADCTGLGPFPTQAGTIVPKSSTINPRLGEWNSALHKREQA